VTSILVQIRTLIVAVYQCIVHLESLCDVLKGGGEERVRFIQGDSPLPCRPEGLDLGRALLYLPRRELFLLLIDRIGQSCSAFRYDLSKIYCKTTSKSQFVAFFNFNVIK
jgi:hypothetical protein